MNIENLFKWSHELELEDKDGEPLIMDGERVKLYQRVVGDADQTKARTEALKRSAKLRKKLRNEDSDEYITYLGDLDDLTNEDMKNAIVLAEMSNIRQVARNQAMLPPKPQPPKSDASLEEQEEYLQEKEGYDDKVQEVVDEETDELVKERKEELKNLHRGTLADIYKEDIIDALCRSEMLETFNSWCTYLGTYKNKAMTERAFSNYEAFNNASSALKRQVTSGYIHLELTGEELKK